jgi:hypothetical protein
MEEPSFFFFFLKEAKGHHFFFGGTQRAIIFFEGHKGPSLVACGRTFNKDHSFIETVTEKD